MDQWNSTSRKLGAIALGGSGLLFAAFPIVRPFYADLISDPASAAVTIASPRWTLSHVMLIGALVALVFGLMRVYAETASTAAARFAFAGMLLGIAGAGLFLPVAGVEAFALPAIVRAYLEGQGTIDTVNAARGGLQATVFAPGLICLALGGICTVIGIWRSRSLPKLAGISLAIGLTFFFPLFPQPVRVVDGLLIGIGGLWLASALWRRVTAAAPERVRAVTAEATSP